MKVKAVLSLDDPPSAEDLAEFRERFPGVEILDLNKAETQEVLESAKYIIAAQVSWKYAKGEALFVIQVWALGQIHKFGVGHVATHLQYTGGLVVPTPIHSTFRRLDCALSTRAPSQ